MEIVLGIDNLVFIAILVGKLPKKSQEIARKLGISFALVTRLGLLFSITWVMGLTSPLFTVASRPISGRDIILFVGGLFLIAKATFEIHDRIEGDENHGSTPSLSRSLVGTILQIALLDIVFSLDSVITAVGMANALSIMVVAMFIAVGVMLLVSTQVNSIIERHPTLKILALSFLLLIGVMLLMEGMSIHVEKGYIYFAMAFSLAVELLNMQYRRRSKARP